MMETAKNYPSFYPPQGTPYLIVAPPYRRYSAGVKVLHFLCNALNRSGQKAYLMISDKIVPGVLPVHPALDTPIMTNEEMGFYRSEGMEPIAVYPELIRDNPLGFKRVVRYLLYFAGGHGGQKRFPASDMIVSYTEAIRKDYGNGGILTLPACDPAIFHPPTSPVERKGSCFYAYKYKLKGGKLLDVTNGSVEITKDFPASVKELADLLRKTEFLYTYENTLLSLEAALCGCPVVQLAGNTETHEFGTDGFSFSTEASEVARAKATVHNIWNNYPIALTRFEEQLKSFIAKTQNWET